MRCVFLPYGDGNPYTGELAGNLSKLGVTVEPPRAGSFFLPRVLAGGKPDILHLHWLHVFFVDKSGLRSVVKLAAFLAQVAFLKLIGVRIVWTAHNLRDHENRNPVVDRTGTRAITRMSDAVIAFCEWSKREIVRRFHVDPNRIAVIPHGHVITRYENRISRAEARKQLGLPDERLVFLMLGLIRPYKGILEFANCFAELNPSEASLLIAGTVYDESLAEAIHSKASTCRNIKFAPGYVPEEKIQVYMNASDVAVFPFRNIHASGSVVLAMSFGKACIAPRIACLPEILDQEGSFLYDPSDPEGLGRALRLAVEARAHLKRMGERNLRRISQWGWDRVAAITVETYRKILS